MTDTTDCRVLVSAGSKHGATAEIARRLARTIGSEGCETVLLAPDDVNEIQGYDAIVLGSAVYAGHWTADAKSLARRIAQSEAIPPVWLFSSGPVGDSPMPEEDPVDVSSIIEETRAREHHVFAGKIDKSKLGFAEKAILVAVRAPEGDYRDWDAIDVWARRIARSLVMEVTSP